MLGPQGKGCFLIVSLVVTPVTTAAATFSLVHLQIVNGSTFFFYVLLLGLASVWAFLCSSEVKVLICLLCTIPEIVVTILGMINFFVDAIFTGIHEQCRSAEANGFLLLNCAVVLLMALLHCK